MNKIQWSRFGYALAILAVAITGPDAAVAADQIVVVTAGGSYGDNQQRAFFAPFGKATGIKVVVEKLPPAEAYAKLKAMTTSGNVQWDVILLESTQVFRGAKENLFEPINYSVVDKANLIPEAVHANGVSVDFYTNQLAYSKKAFPNNSHPKTMAEFFDVVKYPQRRVLRNTAYPTLEHAAHAAKGSPDGLYPLNVDVAFKKLDEIRPFVKVWYTSGAQPAQLIADGEVDLAFGTGARFVDLINKGVEIGIEWVGAVDQDWWVIPKGAKQRDLAMKFVAFTVSAEAQADYVSKSPLGPVNKSAFKLIDANYAKLLPTHPDNFKKLSKADHKWWSENDVALEKQWSAWALRK